MKLVSSGVDAITVSWSRLDEGNKLRYHPDHVMGKYCAEELGGQAGFVKRALGRFGFVGHQYGAMFYGVNENRRLMSIMGETAYFAFKFSYPGKKNCTRIDLQITAYIGEGVDELILKHKKEALEHRESVSGARYKVNHIDGGGDGDTLYIGSRSSDRFVRIYNKGAQSDENDAYKGCIRYEVEFKQATALKVLERLETSPIINSDAISMVLAMLKQRGINIMQELQREGFEPPAKDMPESDIEKKLQWLKAGVSPSVKWLATRIDTASILEALGLDLEVQS